MITNFVVQFVIYEDTDVYSCIYIHTKVSLVPGGSLRKITAHLLSSPGRQDTISLQSCPEVRTNVRLFASL